MPTPYPRTWIDRIQDRLWREVGQRLERRYQVDVVREGAGSSISEATPWVDVCGALADDRMISDGFRRLKAVRDIVETVLSSAAWQDRYIDSHLRHSRHGMIISNAELFSRNIGGRNDEALLDCLRNHGICAWIESENDLLSPGDHLCQVKMIRW
jgi:hypothetical protein